MAEPADRGQRPARRSGLTSPDPVRTGYGPRRPPRTRPRARNPGHAAEQASGTTPTPGFTPQNSSCTNQAGNEPPQLAGGSRLRSPGSRLLRDAGIDVIAQAEDAKALPSEVRQARPDVAVVDTRMPDTDEGLVAAQAIRADHPEIGVLVLSQYVEPSYATRLIQDHPERVGYLLKERVSNIATVVDALRQIVDGKPSSTR